MLYKYQYQDTQEREGLISTHANLFLTEEQNITEGNFLVFSDVLLGEPTPVEVQLAELKEDNLILIDIMLTTYEDMLAKGTV